MRIPEGDKLEFCKFPGFFDFRPMYLFAHMVQTGTNWTMQQCYCTDVYYTLMTLDFAIRQRGNMKATLINTNTTRSIDLN